MRMFLKEKLVHQDYKKLTINLSLYEQSQPLPNRSYFVLEAIYPSGRTKIFANVEVIDF